MSADKNMNTKSPRAGIQNKKARRSYGVSLEDYMPTEVLTKLPVRSLLRFKSVCKKWLAGTLDRSFIANHFNSSNNKERLFLRMHNPGTKTNTFALFTDETLCDYEEPENLLLQPYDEVMNLHGPCKGIFFVVNEHGKMALLNPATKQLKEIPSPEIDAPYHVYSNRFGFGVDPSSCCHFKVIMFRHFVDMAAYNDLDNEDLEDDLSLEESQTYYPLHIGVYTSRTNSWRYFDQDSTDLVKSKRYVIPSLTDTYLDGKYYWVTAYETDDAFGGVIAFDMETESFSNIPVPRSAKCEIFYLALCCGSIALLSYDTASSIDLWLMKDGCWSNDFNIKPPLAGFNVKKPVALWKEDGIIFVDHEKHLIMYNLISKEYKIIGVKPKADILSSAGPSAFAYKESLMPL